MSTSESKVKLVSLETSIVAPGSVYDAEEDKLVVRTPEQRSRAFELLENIAGAEISKAVSLAEFIDGKYYLDVGCASAKEFVETMMPGESLSKVEKTLRIGRRFRPVLTASTAPATGLLEAKNETDDTSGGEAKPEPVPVLDDSTPENELISQVGTLGFRKLLALTRTDDDTFETVTKKGELRADDGTVYTLDDLMAMKTMEVEDLLKKQRRERKQYQAKTSRLEEENKLLKEERKTDQKKIQEADERAEQAFEIECLHGPARNDFEGLKRLLTIADDHLIGLRQALMNVGPRIEDHRALAGKLQRVVSGLFDLANEARLYHAAALEQATDSAALWGMDAVISDILDEEYVDETTDEVITGADNAPAADRHAVSVTINGVAYEPWTATLEATGPDDLTRLLEENADQLPLDVTPDDVRAWAESVWGSLCALPEKARFCDILSQAGITVERAANLDHDEDADDYLLFEAGWEHETRTNSDGFSESRFANPIENLSTMWCQTYDQAVEHAMTLSRKAP